MMCDGEEAEMDWYGMELVVPFFEVNRVSRLSIVNRVL